jgi:hypothetical protein
MTARQCRAAQRERTRQAREKASMTHVRAPLG